jgi:DNA primase
VKAGTTTFKEAIMPKTHALSFKDLKQRVSIEHVLRHYELFEGLRMRGKSHRGPCPLCEAEEGVPFSVSLEKNCFHCFSCRASGNVLDFVAKWEGVTIREAGQLLNKNFVDGKESHHRPQGIQQEAQKAPDQPEAPDVLITGDTLKEQPSKNEPLTFTLKNIELNHPSVKALGIPEDTLTAFGVGFYSGRGMMGNRIVIPVHNTALELVAYAGYHPDERTYTYPPKFRRELELYNLKGALLSEKTPDHGLILVRHPLEALMLISAGEGNAVALMGESISKEQAALLLESNGSAERVTLFWPTHTDVVPTLSELLPHFLCGFDGMRKKETSLSGSQLKKPGNSSDNFFRRPNGASFSCTHWLLLLTRHRPGVQERQALD